MTDVHSEKVRSYNMSRVRSKDTKPEMLVRKFLFSKGFRYRLHDKKLPSKPDIVLRKYRTVIFIHGCFWHGHQGCPYFVIPRTRTDWWMNKISLNQSNDRQSLLKLESAGWKIIVVWECDLKKDKREATLQHIENQLLF